MLRENFSFSLLGQLLLALTGPRGITARFRRRISQEQSTRNSLTTHSFSAFQENPTGTFLADLQNQEDVTILTSRFTDVPSLLVVIPDTESANKVARYVGLSQPFTFDLRARLALITRMPIRWSITGKEELQRSENITA